MLLLTTEFAARTNFTGGTLTSLFDAALRTVPVAMAIIDPELRYLRVNEACATMTGLTVDAHPGKHLREVNPLLSVEMETIMR
jgi:PAS domain S-box-containing protein